jgi:hypothetical protein
MARVMVQAKTRSILEQAGRVSLSAEFLTLFPVPLSPRIKALRARLMVEHRPIDQKITQNNSQSHSRLSLPTIFEAKFSKVFDVCHGEETSFQNAEIGPSTP